MDVLSRVLLITLAVLCCYEVCYTAGARNRPDDLPCVILLHNTSGEITSPNYPDKYGNDDKCKWVIWGSPDSTVTLTFVDFQVEDSIDCWFDKVKVYDGDKRSRDRVLAKLCGEELPSPITTTSNAMTIIFRSDFGRNFRGFRARYTINHPAPLAPQALQMNTPEPPALVRYIEHHSSCGAVLDEESGSFASPNYPRMYGINERCIWVIRGQPGTVISLIFTDLSLEESDQCRYDVAKVFDTGAEISQVPMATLCGPQSSPAPIISSGNNMTVTFKSDDSTNFRGFRAQYSALFPF